MRTHRKRGREHSGSHEEGGISIRVSDDCTLVAQENLVRLCSTCASGLPEGTAEWDLRILYSEGEPVDKATVVAWLNCAYDRLQDDIFMPEDHDVRCTVAGLTRLLTFADAVGTTRGVLAACLTELKDLIMVVELPGVAWSTKVTLETDGGAYFFQDYRDHAEPYNGGCQHLAWATASSGYRYVSGTCSPWSDEQKIFRQRVAQQIEPLLHLAHKLELQPLITRLHTFISSSAMRDSGILWGVLDAVFTDRVLAETVSDRATEAAKDAWIDSVLTIPCGLSSEAGLPVGRLLELTSRVPEPLRFEARLHDRILGAHTGDKVRVTLDLFGDSTIKVGGLTVPVVLQLGQGPLREMDWSERRAMMSGDLREDSGSPTSSQDTAH